MQGQRKSSDILTELETRLANLEIGNYTNSIQLARLADERDDMSRKAREYEQMFQLAKGTLKKIASSLSHLNANQSDAKCLRDKIKTIRILLEDYNTKVIKKDYEISSD